MTGRPAPALAGEGRDDEVAVAVEPRNAERGGDGGSTILIVLGVVGDIVHVEGEDVGAVGEFGVRHFCIPLSFLCEYIIACGRAVVKLRYRKQYRQV